MAKQKTYIIQGIITNQQNQPIQGVLVRATDQDYGASANLLGSPIYTDKKGYYKITYTDTDFRKTTKEIGGSDIIVRVFSTDGNVLGKSKRLRDAPKELKVDLKVDYNPSIRERKLKVSGQIKLQDKKAANGFFVQVFDKQLRSEQLLGEGITDKKGKYAITYSSNDIIKVERNSIDIFIKVFDPKNRPVGQSDILFGASAKATVDFDINANDMSTMSEFELLELAIIPLLSGEPILKLDQSEKHQDITFLSGETGYTTSQVLHFVQAHHFEKESSINASFWYVVLGIPFYKDLSYANLAAQREQIKEKLYTLSEKGIRKALKRAFRQHQVDIANEKTIKKWVNTFKKYVAEVQLSEPVLKNSFVRQSLETAGITDKKKQSKFAEVFHTHKAFSPEMVKVLKKDRSFKAAEIKDLEVSYALNKFTKGNFELVKAIKTSFSVKDPKDIQVLAKRSKEEWKELVAKTPEIQPLPIPSELKVFEGEKQGLSEIYANTLHKQFQTTFPTTMFSGDLDRAINKQAVSGFKKAGEIKKVLDANPDFDFLTTPINEFIEKDSVLKKDEDLQLEFKAIQRVFKLTSDFEGSHTLLKDGLHSAHSVYLTGESEFVKRYKDQPGFTKKSAKSTWFKAQATHAATVSLLAELKATENAGDVAALRAGSSAVSDFPNWNNLFKGGDICECKHCRSVYSPAAYFADLLMFLSKRRQDGKSAKDTLFKRRPDLGYLELNCENANVTLPYIDVVCEVLEDVVADGDNDLELMGFNTIDATDQESATTSIVSAFQDNNINLIGAVHSSRIGSTDNWIVHSSTITYLLKKKGTVNYFAEILRNTKAKADELRANPNYTNKAAYDKLREARYPFSLPFDLYGEEIKAAFKKVKIKRWALMQLFKGNTAPYDITEDDLAAVYFDIVVDSDAVVDEKTMMLQAMPDRQFEYWGTSDNTVLLDTIKNVNTFLRTSGLDYNQLLKLLDLEFINPLGTIKIAHLDPTCDTEQKIIQHLDVKALDRIHRFLRLWRKLGWELWEVDLVIMQEGIGNGILDEQFLINLMYLMELKNKLGVKVTIAQVCSLFGNINTKTKFTKLHEKRENALYQELFLNKKLIHPLDTAFEVSSVNTPSSTEKIKDHLPVIQAGLRIKETDLDIFINLTKVDGNTYIPNGIDGDLNLINLSFLYRNSFLTKALKIKASDWKTFLKIYSTDIAIFSNPQSACEFVEVIKTIQSSKFKIDELNYILMGDQEAKSAFSETSTTLFLSALRSSLQDIRNEFDANQYDFLEDTPPKETEKLTALLTELLQRLNRKDQEIDNILKVLENVRINETLQQDLLFLKFYEPKFSTPLSELSVTIDFNTQLSKELAKKVMFNSAENKLHFDGIMSEREKEILKGLSSDSAYLDAIDALYLQPTVGVFEQNELWIDETDLDYEADGFYPIHLVLAINKLLTCFIEKESKSTIIKQFSAQIGIPVNLNQKLMQTYQLIGTETPLAYFKNTFATSSGVINSIDFKDAFDSFYWLYRVGLLVDKWKLNFADLDWLIKYHIPTQTLNFSELPINKTSTIIFLDKFLRTEKLLKLNTPFNNEKNNLFKVLGKLQHNEYADTTEFANELEVLTSWNATEIEIWIDHVNLSYHTDYLLAENWERLLNAMNILHYLDTDILSVIPFAKPTMGLDDSKSIKQILRSKYGTETWLSISTEIQDVIREQKRDALSAYILAQPKPEDAPTGKWENTNDLYAYYLLDTKMSSCMVTSRLVQGSGSIQLFVQRCFMGLEPEVVVKSDGEDGDSAWKWWKWMRKYRVWEANRKVFLYPENWIEPELRPDKSSFFQDLENELLQNEVNQLSAEKAYLNYLDKLNNVARLDIAGFYQEDDGDETIIHMFGRTPNADPHLYYYRQYDYRRWTPWEKIEVDIVGDHLIPMVVNKRLYIYWPEFREVSDDTLNNTIRIPDAGEDNYPIEPTNKITQLRLAGSEYRNNKWIPKKISKDYYPSNSYTESFDTKSLKFYPIDRSEFDGRVGIKFEGSNIKNGAFELFGCEGVPVKTDFRAGFQHLVAPDRSDLEFLDYKENVNVDVENDFTLTQNFLFSQDSSANTDYEILAQTPNVFNSYFPWHLSLMDKSFLGIRTILQIWESGLPIGMWLPFSYADAKKTFMAFPMYIENEEEPDDSQILYYPEIKTIYNEYISGLEDYARTYADGLDLSSSTQADKLLAANIYLGFLGENQVSTITNPELRDIIFKYIVRIGQINLGGNFLQEFHKRKYHFKNFYHPFICDFIKAVYNPLKGIPALMSRETQLKDSGFSFKKLYQPTSNVYDFNINTGNQYPKEIVDFSPDGSYAPYNWELFYHIPLMIANSLSKNQRFEEAMDWYHYIFNPIGVEGKLADGSGATAPAPQKYWITKPFFKITSEEYKKQRIDSILRIVAGDDTVDSFTTQLKNDMQAQVIDWRYHPFEPHRIAQYRNVAYQKTVFMKYMDNLIAWGDYLFRQDSMESINEATQLYILAAELLGPRPKKIPPQVQPPVETFVELEGQLDSYSNALIEVENHIPVISSEGESGEVSAPIPTLYFCIPQNNKLLGYWDIITDRLHKIRNCMNIDGVVRQLSLFEPEIDPGALVKAVASRMEVSSALSDFNSSSPYYRFNILLQKANEVCNELKSLGNALLSALEKKDGEELVLLRQEHEYKLLDAIKSVRKLQIEESKGNLEALKEGKKTTEIRRDYYQQIEKINTKEQLNIDKLNEAHGYQEAAQGVTLAASIISLLPDIDLGASGFGGSPLAKFKIGGLNLGQASKLASDILSFLATISTNDATMASIKGGQDRRWDDWKLQEAISDQELIQIEEQIKAAETRIQIAEKELANHEVQLENSKEVDDFMQSKYTNQQLYQWMVGQVSQTFFESYQLAYDLAKKAERCYRFELGISDSDFIKFGYWDSLKKGLLSGEKLQYDLRRLETSYLEQNKRELELTKHVSLKLLDPIALVKLKETGKCFLTLPEEIFDLDYPGHYFRRIKSVSISLPCIAGPYTTISCSLRLLKNHIRIKTNIVEGYEHNNEKGVWVNDERFVQNNIPIKSIAASSAQNDSGMFELNFRDERYLPFEGAGVISEWTIDLFNDARGGDFGKSLRQFDFSTISDAIIHVKYTAREAGGLLKDHAIANLKEYFGKDDGTPAMKIIDLKREFSSSWHKFLHPDTDAEENVLEFTIKPQLFSFRDKGKTLKVNTISLIARCSETGDYTFRFSPPLPLPSATDVDTLILKQNSDYGNLHVKEKIDTSGHDLILNLSAEVIWKLIVESPTETQLSTNEIEDFYLILGYEWID